MGKQATPFIDASTLESTRFYTAEYKARAVNAFLRFVESDFKRSKFTQVVWRFLHSEALCMNAVYDASGFYVCHFSKREAQARLLKDFLDEADDCNPSRLRADLWQDVLVQFTEETDEGKARVAWMRAHIDRARQAGRDETERAERAQLDHLLGKYRVPEGFSSKDTSA